jgi:O-antigen ligase
MVKTPQPKASRVRPKGATASKWSFSLAMDGPRLATMAIFVLLTFMVMGPFISYKPEPFTGEGNPLKQGIYVIVLIMALIAINFPEYPSRMLAIPITICAALFWFALSLTWAIAPAIGVRRLFFTVIITWSIFMSVQRAGYDRTVNVIHIVLPILLVVNYVAVAIAPGFAIHHVAEEGGDDNLVGAWRGVMMQKNFAGATCAFTVMYFVLAAKNIKFWKSAVIILLSAFFLYKTQSKTSMGMLAISLLIGGLYRLYKPRYRVHVIGGVLVLLLLTFLGLIVYWDDVSAPFVSRDGFTGRTQIWPVIVNYWLDHPFTGSGYGSFWNIGTESPIFTYTQSWVTHLGNGHNGYLDLLAQTGIPGLVLSVAAGIIWPLAQLLINPSIDRARGSVIIATIWFAAWHNVTETSLFDRDAIVQIFLLFALAFLSLETRIGGKKTISAKRTDIHGTPKSPSKPIASGFRT